MKEEKFNLSELEVIEPNDDKKIPKSELIRNDFENFIKNCRRCEGEENQKLLWKAFEIANHASKESRKTQMNFILNTLLLLQK
jgi:hypothetical protein